jgi:sugar-specific transcriptional regulator TrmB
MVLSDEFCSLLKKSGSFDDLEVKIIKSMMNLTTRRDNKFTAGVIAKQAKMSVTNAYKYLYSLQEKGIIESSKNKNKVFWLSGSSNPFPRVFSFVTQEYLDRKELFSRLSVVYDRMIKADSVWDGEKIYEHYSGDFTGRASFLLDAAKEEILITSKKFYDDFILLDSIKRAVSRGVTIRIIAEEARAETVTKLKTIDIELRLGKAWPYAIVVDGNHGMTIDGGGGVWFLNYNSEYKKRFEDLWEKADVI